MDFSGRILPNQIQADFDSKRAPKMLNRLLEMLNHPFSSPDLSHFCLFLPLL
jgi:hypothetical protein